MGRDAKTVSPPTRIAAIPFKKNGKWRMENLGALLRQQKGSTIFHFQLSIKKEVQSVSDRTSF